MRRRNTGLPDHAPKPVGQKTPLPKKDKIAALSRKYGFSDDFPLVERMTHAYLFEAGARSIQHKEYPQGRLPTISEVKQLLSEFREQSENVRYVLGLFGGPEYKCLSPHLDHVFDRLQQLDLLLEQAATAAGKAVNDLQGERSSRPREESRYVFIKVLAGIWCEGTGLEPKVWYNDFENRFSGQFYEFVVDSAQLGGVELSSGGDPGNTIKSALNEWRKDEAKS